MRLLPIVEGAGEVEAMPILLRRLLTERHGIYDVQVLRPYRYGELGKMSKNFARNVLVAAKENAPILWTADCDDGCPITWVNHFEQNIPAGFPVPIRFALFVREYESMFLAEHNCLITKLALDPATPSLPNPETYRDAKGEITRMMPPGTAYKEMVNQPSLSAAIDLAAAIANSRSLRHLDSALLSLVHPT
jgi:hypothetical protein